MRRSVNIGMSSRKFQYMVAHRDPEMVAELRADLMEMWREELAELRRLRELSPSPYRVDPKSANAGEKWLSEASKSEYRATARAVRKSTQIRLLHDIMDALIVPQHREEQDEVADANAERRAKALALRAAIRGDLPEDEHRALAVELGGDFNIPMPEGTRE